MGCNDCICKPIEWVQLAHLIHRFVPGRSAQDRSSFPTIRESGVFLTYHFPQSCPCTWFSTMHQIGVWNDIPSMVEVVTSMRALVRLSAWAKYAASRCLERGVSVMGRNLTTVLGGLVGAVLIAGTLRQAAADSPSPAATELTGPRELGKHVQDITDTVLRHHLDPPARQQMILAGIKGLYEAAGLPIPAGLSRRVSALTTPEQFTALLVELWPSKPAKSIRTGDLEEALVNGLLASVPGGAEITSAKEHEVQEQFQGNRYVGIHIQVRYDEKEKRTIIDGIVPGGPADRAGMMREDRFEQIDGVDTKDMTLRQVVDRLRGADGTDVSVTVRQPKGEARTLKATRGPLFIATITGVQKKTSGEWDYLRRWR